MESSTLNHRMITRSKLNEESEASLYKKDTSKRLAENIPDFRNKKRILGDITNQAKVISTIKSNIVTRKNKKLDENSLSNNELCKVSIKEEPLVRQDCLEDSIYVTALEDSLNSTLRKKGIEKIVRKPLPEGVEDFDKTCAKDQYSESRYAFDIFNYYLEREKLFPIKKYLDHQKEITKKMRAVLVDWMVEVQESFELNHETLYLAVKLVDLYLMKSFVPKSQLQLVGATAICIAAKYDERQPPLVDDFLYICDDTYSREQLIRTEIKILETVKFDLGIPLSYRFLRRFARCSKSPMELLTLARYILETALMDYDLIEELDSKMAAASLLLALKMKKQHWSATHEYYTNYKEDELMELVMALNKNISGPPSSHLQTIRVKYSHQVFFEVSKIPPLECKM